VTDRRAPTASAPELSNLVYLYLKEKSQICEAFPVDVVVEAAQQLFRTYDLGGTVYGMANGGNSGTLDHCYVDFRHHPFVDDTKSRAMPDTVPRCTFVNLAGSPAELTGTVNDLGAEDMFAAALRGRVTERDFVMAYSGSGNSANVLAALKLAAAHGARTFAMTKGSGGQCRELADICLNVPGTSAFPGQTGANDNNFHFEDFMLSFNHMLVGLLRRYVNATVI
jgi:D-sedoheptulose 7-phosphate isomerase